MIRAVLAGGAQDGAQLTLEDGAGDIVRIPVVPVPQFLTGPADLKPAQHDELIYIWRGKVSAAGRRMYVLDQR